MKNAVVVLSDPKTGQEEALGRLFNAMATVYDFKQRGDEVRLYFQGTGTRWVEHLTEPDHPVYDLYEAIKDKVVGVSCGCADVFGARDAAEEGGFDLVRDNSVPGTSGLPSLAGLVADGFNVLTF